MSKQSKYYTINVFFDERNQPFDSTILSAFETIREGTSLSKSACASRLMTLGALMHDLVVARAYGVWFLHLDPAGGLEDPKVAAIAYRGGKLITRGEEAHVRAKLEHLGIEVVAECGGSEPHVHCVVEPVL